MQQKWKDDAKALKIVHTSITKFNESLMQCKGAQLELANKTREQVELEKVKLQIIIQRNKQLTSFITNIQTSDARLQNNVDFMVKSHNIPSVGSITKVSSRNQVR